jgi:hypothetical protein
MQVAPVEKKYNTRTPQHTTVMLCQHQMFAPFAAVKQVSQQSQASQHCLLLSLPPCHCPPLASQNVARRSELAVVGEAWEGNNIPNILHAGAELHKPLEAQPKARVWH